MSAIDDAYQTLLAAFTNTGVFWQSGNAFDTMLDYIALNPSAAAGMDTLALNKFGSTQGNRCWYDDDGWWLIAGIKAVQLAPRVGWDENGLKSMVQNLWGRFSENAPYVWDEDQSVYPSCKPLIDGGVWNSGWPNDPCGNPCNPSQNNPPNLCGIQNTVTNGLFMVGAQRLANTGQNPAGIAASDNEYGFLSSWFGTPPNGADPLLYPVTAGSVVRERVTAYDSSQPVYGYEPRMAWLGDQGLILGGLVARMQVLQWADYQQALTWARSILQGVPSYLTNGSNQILESWTPGMSPPGNDSPDYSTGTGIFFRYLVDVWANPDLRASMQGTWPGIVAANAAATPANTDLVGATNRLSVLLAAQAIA